MKLESLNANLLKLDECDNVDYASKNHKEFYMNDIQKFKEFVKSDLYKMFLVVEDSELNDGKWILKPVMLDINTYELYSSYTDYIKQWDESLLITPGYKDYIKWNIDDIETDTIRKRFFEEILLKIEEHEKTN